jgi:hypothetical protein
VQDTSEQRRQIRLATNRFNEIEQGLLSRQRFEGGEVQVLTRNGNITGKRANYWMDAAAVIIEAGSGSREAPAGSASCPIGMPGQAPQRGADGFRERFAHRSTQIAGTIPFAHRTPPVFAPALPGQPRGQAM